MRVVAGRFRGSKLASPDGETVRPTSDKVREALFNILQARTEGSVFLDLFGGTGAVGIEALSRGAKKVVFVDNSKLSRSVILSNLQKFNVNNAEFVYKDAVAAVKFFAETNQTFDIIYIDPPYNTPLDSRVLENLAKFDILFEHGLIIVEHNAEKDLQINPDSFIIVDTRKYGKTSLTFLSKRC